MSVKDNKNPRNSTKDRLLNAAVKIFHQKGFQKTRVSDIVSEASLAQGTFYLYFKSKEDIFKQITIEHSSRFVTVFDETKELFKGRNPKDIRQNISHFLNNLLEVYKQNIQISELLFREIRGHGGIFTDVQINLFNSFIRLLQKHMKRDLPQRKFNHKDSEIDAIFLLGIFLYSTDYFLLMKKQFNTEKLGHKMTDFMLNGLKLDHDSLSPRKLNRHTNTKGKTM
ncbi:MAG: TetR/AcrR family transcriptional regulator [Thermodesulfobacteriota bacterium]